MDYDISELNSLDLDQLKSLCLKLGVSIHIEKQDLISRLIAKFPPRLNTTEEIIQIKKEISEDNIKFNHYSNCQSKIQYSRAKSVASDLGTLNSDISLNFGPESSPSNSSSYAGVAKPAPASLSKSIPNNQLNTQNVISIKTSKTFAFKPIVIKEKAPISVAEELKKRQKRAEKFNGTAPSNKKSNSSILVPSNLPVASLTAVSSLPFEEKLRKRAERFGMESTSVLSELTSTPPNPEKKSLKNKPQITKNKSIERSKEIKKKLFVEEDKKKLEARSKRFNADSFSKVITKEDPKKLLQRSKRFKT